jgi:hypothetical protein
MDHGLLQGMSIIQQECNTGCSMSEAVIHVHGSTKVCTEMYGTKRYSVMIIHPHHYKLHFSTVNYMASAKARHRAMAVAIQPATSCFDHQSRGTTEGQYPLGYSV